MTPPTAAVEDYLKCVHKLGGAERPVAPGDIAAQIGVKAPSVTGMLKRLAEVGLISYTPGQKAMLTPSGVAAARRVIRRHRLIELLLTRTLGLDWSEVDAEAEALEHAISPRLEEAIAAHLGEPVEDPHGHPIPTSTGELPARDLTPLVAFRPGDQILIREVQDDNPERLRRWRELGLTPGVMVTVMAYDQLDDLFEMAVDGVTVRVGSGGLVGLRGERIS